MEAIMAAETTKVKKMDDNCTMRGKEYSKRALRGLGNGKDLERKRKKQVRKYRLKQVLQKMK